MNAALGCFVAFDHVLHDDPGPLDRLLATPLAGKPLVEAFTKVYWKRAESMRGKEPGPFDWSRMRPRIVDGEVVTFGPSNIVRSLADPDERRIELLVDTAPLAVVPRMPDQQPRGDLPGRHYRYDLTLGIGAGWLDEPGAGAIVEAIQRFATDVAAVAGVIAAVPTHREAMAIAGYGGGEPDSPLAARARKLWSAHWTWGPKAREPEWGTFLARAHADAIGGVGAIRAAADPFRIVEHDALVFVQLTPYADALAPETDEKRARLETLMRPVLTEKLSRPAPAPHVSAETPAGG